MTIFGTCRLGRKTRRDVGMVDSLSDATGSAWKNQLVENVQEEGVYSYSVTV